MSHHQGGIALVYREFPYWQVESSVLHQLNAISAVIVSGNLRYRIVGTYVPLADTTTLVHIAAALGYFPQRKVILLGDLDLDLNSIETDRDMDITDTLAESRLLDMHHHFKLRRKFKRQNIWHQKREENVAQSKPDYFLCSN